MFDELRKKLHTLKTRVTKKQQEPITLTPPILQDDNLPFTLETYLDGHMKVLKLSEYIPEKIAFYAGNPTAKQDEIAGKLEALMENIDEVLSAKHRFLNILEEL